MRLPLASLTTAFLLSSALLAASAAAEGPTAVDDARIHAAAPEGAPPIVVHLFGTDEADLGTGEKKNKPKYQEVARQMKATAPITLAQSLVHQLDDRDVLGGGLLADHEEEPDGALHLRGDFTVLNPGSRGKRFWVGLGAGRSRVCVHAELLDADGEALLDLDHCRSGTGSWSFAGGRSEGMMINDLAGTAEKIAHFLDDWAAGRHRP